ncbi:MAG: HlyD family efflux transporter periplasmic adaptor subunit [Magnetococcales bacterium]|nr:HlyD family efflux transporter periplasmic adaptor subunit [Magnetococcales bacterium]
MESAIVTQLPDLREELSLHPGPHAADGSPTWTLHDPASNRFFRLGLTEFEMLSRWDLGNPEAIAQAIDRQTSLKLTPYEVERFAQHLMQSHLIRPGHFQERERFVQIQYKSRPHWGRWLLHHYLFLRFSLWHPDRFLDRTLPFITWLFSKEFLIILATMALIALGLIIRQWESFYTTFPYFFSWSGLLAYGGVLSLSKMVHELGHAYAAKRFGCRVPSMGVALLVMVPVLYTETSDVWKLTSRRQRMAVGLAGMAAELMLAAMAALAWSFLADGPLRSAAFLLASALWMITLTINLNPMMRFDGYFVLSDFLEIPNLYDRAFALGRWRLREWLFGFNLKPPEHLPPSRQNLLIVLAFSIWIYRLFLFFGIALLVYHVTFKLLGIFLFLVEIGWFILRPMGREIMVWYRLRDTLRFNRNLGLTGVLLLSMILVMVHPWQVTIAQAPAMLQAENHMVIYAPASARVTQMPVRSGQSVVQGDVLLQLTDPDLQHRLESIERTIVMTRWRLAVQGVDFSESVGDSATQKSAQTLEEELITALTQRQAIQAELGKLRVLAPFSGMVVDVVEDVAIGDWVSAKEPLLTMIDAQRPIVKGYVSELQFSQVKPGDVGIFHPDNPDLSPLSGRVLRKDRATTHVLSEPYLASLYGGTLPVRKDRNGKLVVEGAMYRVDLGLDQDSTVSSVTRGTISVTGVPQRPIFRMWQALHAVLVRESGF